MAWLEQQGLLHAEELDLVRRGRNSAGRGPRRADAAVYARATGFETMVGWLFLNNPVRLAELLDQLGDGRIQFDNPAPNSMSPRFERRSGGPPAMVAREGLAVVARQEDARLRQEDARRHLVIPTGIPTADRRGDMTIADRRGSARAVIALTGIDHPAAVHRMSGYERPFFSRSRLL